jgi:hypothetical protein
MFLIMLSLALSFSLFGIILPSKLSDFHPISIVSVLSKGFECLIHGQIVAHVERSILLSVFQSGFRCDHSNTTALVRASKDLRTSMVEGKRTVVVLLDFRKAFNFVDLFFCTSLFVF